MDREAQDVKKSIVIGTDLKTVKQVDRLAFRIELHSGQAIILECSTKEEI